MHICFITNEFPKEGFAHGGIGTFVSTIAPDLVAHGIKVTVVGLNYTDENEAFQDGGFSLFRLPKSRIRFFSWLQNSVRINRKLAEIHKADPIDIIESPELGLAFISRIPGVKNIIRLHGGHHFFAEAENRGINRWKGFQEKRSFKKADGFIAVSDYVKTHTSKFLSFHGKPIVKVNSPINLELFKPMSEIPVRGNLIVFAGTVCEKKGVRQLVKAFGLVRQKFPSARLELYGRDWLYPDGRSYIEEMKREVLPEIGDAAASVVFMGAVPYGDLPSKYASASVCVFPSHMETQGLVAPEAMAMAKAVVFTKEGPGPETIVDGETGLLCDPYDPVDIADKIMSILQSPDFAIKLGDKASLTARIKYNLEKLSTSNIEFYKRITAR